MENKLALLGGEAQLFLIKERKVKKKAKQETFQ